MVVGKSPNAQIVVPRLVATRAQSGAVQEQCFQNRSSTVLTALRLVRASVKTEDVKIMRKPVYVHGMVAQDRFLGKTKMLEQL